MFKRYHFLATGYEAPQEGKVDSKPLKFQGSYVLQNYLFNCCIWTNNQTSRIHRLAFIATLHIAYEKCILLYNQNEHFFNMLLEATFAREDNGLYKLYCAEPILVKNRDRIHSSEHFKSLFFLYSWISISLLDSSEAAKSLKWHYITVV